MSEAKSAGKTKRRASFPRIRGLFVYDENGNWIATSQRINAAGLNNSDRDYFRYHRQHPSREPLIGLPVKSRSGGEWIITVSRRFNHPDGSFAGVVLATVDSEYFEEFYRSFDIGNSGSITLLSASGIIFARTPDNGRQIGRDWSSAPLFRELSSRPKESVYYFKSAIDGSQRLSFYKRSDRFPIVVVATWV